MTHVRTVSSSCDSRPHSQPAKRRSEPPAHASSRTESTALPAAKSPITVPGWAIQHTKIATKIIQALTGEFQMLTQYPNFTFFSLWHQSFTPMHLSQRYKKFRHVRVYLCKRSNQNSPRIQQLIKLFSLLRSSLTITVNVMLSLCTS